MEHDIFYAIILMLGGQRVKVDMQVERYVSDTGLPDQDEKFIRK